MHQMTQIPAHRSCCCGHNIHIHTDYRNPVEEKGRHSHSLKRKVPLSASATPSRGSALTLALTGFYCFPRPLTSKMVLLYYAKFCFGWLSFADKGEGVAEYIKGGYLQCKGRSGLNRLCSISGRSSSDFGKIKILSKHLLPQGKGVLARASLIAV